MASDIILSIDGVEGESKTKTNCIDVMSYSWGLSNSGSASLGGGMGTGKASFQDLHFTTTISKASPALGMLCATGKHISKATLHQRKSTGDNETKEFLIITLEDILVSSYNTGASEGSGMPPVDQFSFNYSKIKMEYKVQGDDGSMQAGGEFSYNIKEGKNV